MSTSIPITTLDVPQSFCHQNWQATWPFLVGLLRAKAEGLAYNFGNTTPSAEDRDKGWFRTNADGTPDGWYAYANGSWLKRTTLPDPGAIMMWDGLETDITTLDGGEAGAVTPTTGPFWARVTAMDGRFPLGVGTFGTTAVAVGDVGGAHEVTLALQEMPLHDHGLPGNKLVMHQTPAAGFLQQVSGTGSSVIGFQAEGGKTDGTTKPHANMPPYRGVFFIKRTSRLYHRSP